MEKIYDVLIIGGGVAGMSCAVYAKRAGKSVAIIEKMSLGGQVLSLEKIENFPSQTLIDGISLAQMFSKQIKFLDVEILRDEIISVNFSAQTKVLTGKKDDYRAKNVVIATGIKSRQLGLDEEKLLGQGVSYCATCDGNFFKNKEVCVASQKGSGVLDALYLCSIASSVTLLDSQDMSIFANANKNEKLKVVSNCNITEILRNENGLKILAQVNGDKKEFSFSALFVELGKIPATSIFEGVLKLDEKGYIVTDEKMQTSVSGVFAIGDVRNGTLKQIVTACADGAIAGSTCA